MANLHPEARQQVPLHDYTVGWISALPIERAAAELLLDEVHKPPPLQANDPTIYTLGKIAGHNTVLACLNPGVTGTTSAAVIAMRLSARFQSVKIGLMVGVGGGVPSEDHDIRLGDVVVSQPSDTHGGVVQYDKGKRRPDDQFQRTGHLDKPPNLLLQALSRVQTDHIKDNTAFTSHLARIEENARFARRNAGPDELFQLIEPQGEDDDVVDQRAHEELVKREERLEFELVQVHYGTIASGNSVIRDAAERDRIAQDLGGDILCFEMEAAGLMNDFLCLVVRGICDYADSHKHKRWQPYAAAAAAAYAKEILSALPAMEVAQMRPIQGMLQSIAGSCK